MSVQYRVVIGKKDEIVDGPDDAELVVSVPLVEVQAAGFDPVVAYMQGKLKSTGPTGPLFDAAALGRRGEPSSPGSLHVPEVAVADQHGADLGQQRRQTGIVDDQREVVDPRLGRRRQGADLGRVDGRLDVDLGDPRLRARAMAP